MFKLFQFLLWVGAWLVGALGEHVAKKVAVGGALLVVLLGSLAAFYLVIKGLVAGVMLYVTDPWLLMGFYVAWPPNADVAISSVLAAKVAAFVYRTQVANARAVASVS